MPVFVVHLDAHGPIYEGVWGLKSLGFEVPVGLFGVFGQAQTDWYMTGYFNLQDVGIPFFRF